MPQEKKATPFGKEIGKRIRELREATGKTIPEMAKAVGVTNDTISKIQSGQTTVQFQKLAKIAEFLGVTPNDLLGVESANGAAFEWALHEVLEKCFRELKLREPDASLLVRTIVSIVLRPEPAPEGVDPQAAARVRISDVARQVAKLRH